MTTGDYHYQRFVRATPEELFAAISTPEGILRWWHATTYAAPLVEGVSYESVLGDGRVATRGRVLRLEAPYRLVQTWQPVYSEDLASEPAGTLEWTVERAGEGLSRLRLAHVGLSGSPRTADNVRDGWEWVLDNLKSVLETGQQLPDWDIEQPGDLAPHTGPFP